MIAVIPGAAFTRFQTMRYQRAFPGHIDGLVSYGSCQMPTLGFVARRFVDRESFIPQKFWKLKCTSGEDLVSKSNLIYSLFSYIQYSDAHVEQFDC